MQFSASSSSRKVSVDTLSTAAVLGLLGDGSTVESIKMHIEFARICNAIRRTVNPQFISNLNQNIVVP